MEPGSRTACWLAGLASLALAGATAPVSAAGRIVQVELRQARLPLRVECGPASRGSCRRLRETAVRALPRIEALLGRAPGASSPTLRVVSGPERMGGVDYRSDPGGEALEVHPRTADWQVVAGLAGFWWNVTTLAEPTGREAWVAVGLSLWLAVEVLRVEPRLGDAARVHRVHIEEGWEQAPRGFDPPLSTWSPPYPPGPALLPAVSAWQGKAYAFFGALAHAMGPGALKEVLARILGSGRPVPSAEILASLGRELPGAGAGWVVEDGRPAFPPRELGRTVVLGLPPPPGTAPRHHVTDPEDPGIEAASDLLEAGIRCEADWWTVDLKVRGDFSDPGPTWCIGLDLDGDSKFDRLVGFGSKDAPWVTEIHGSMEDCDYKIWDRALVARQGSRAVLSIPRDALGLETGPVRASVYSVNGPPVQKRDSLPWIRFEPTAP